MQIHCEHHDAIPVMSGASAKISIMLKRRMKPEERPEPDEVPAPEEDEPIDIHDHHHHHHDHHHDHRVDGWEKLKDFEDMDGRRLFVFLVCCDQVVWEHEVEEIDFHNGVISVPLTAEDTLNLEDRVCKVQIALERNGEVLAGVHYNDDIYIHFKKWEAGKWLMRHAR